MHMAWDELAAKHRSDRDFQNIVSTVRRIKAGEADKPEKLESVSAQHNVSLRIIRSYIVLSEREMRRESGLSRTPKMLLKSIPTLETLNENGCPGETLYCFADSERPHRRAELVCDQSLVCLKDVLSTQSFCWESQGEAYFRKESKDVADANGAANLVNKAVWLPKWEQFLDEKLMPSGGDTEEETGGQEQTVDTPEASAFTGPAAEELAASQAVATPKAIKRPAVCVDSSTESKLRRCQSSRSLTAEGDAEVASTCDRESTFAEAEDLEGHGVREQSEAQLLLIEVFRVFSLCPHTPATPKENK